MKIAIFSTNYGGGAAIAARRLHEGLKRLGKDCVFITRDSKSQEEQVEHLKTTPVTKIRTILAKVRRRIPVTPSYSWDYYHHVKYSNACELFSDFRADVFRSGGHLLPHANIINLHWVSYFLDLPSVFKHYAGKVPIVWTLHDMNALTGGCHYDNLCGQYLTHCSNCPQLASPGPKDAAHAIYAAKKRFFDTVSPTALCLVSPSKWLDEQVAASPIFSKFHHCVIPNGINTEEFRPIPSQTESHHGAKPTLLFIASDLSNPRKGYPILLSALKDLDREGISFTLKTVGETINFAQEYKNITFVNHGFVKNTYDLASIYSQADALLLPSMQDNLPNTIIESLACGTPIIASSVGGIPDAVRPNHTGWLARDTSANSLALTIRQALKDISSGLSFRSICRSTAVNEYSITVQASKYLELYNKLLANTMR